LPKLLALQLLTRTAEQPIINFIQTTNAKIFNFGELEKIKDRTNYIPEVFTKRVVRERELINNKGGITYLSNKLEMNILNKYHLSIVQLAAMDKDSFKKLTGKNKKDIELLSQIKYQYLLKQRREELKKHLPTGLNLDMLPKRVLDYLMQSNERNEKKKIHQKIKDIKDEAKLLNKSIKKEIEKTQQEQRIKLGEIATFIASDMLNMIIDKELKSRITNPYYNKLQNKIAYFSLNKGEIISICDELSLFDTKKGHVFLTRNLIFKSTGIIDFYQNYLEAKIAWIDNKLFVKGKMGGYTIPNNNVPYSILKIKNEIRTYNFNTWLKNKIISPVELPNSLMDDQLAKVLKSALKKESKTYNDGDKFSILLAKYLSNDSQPFYEYTRNYTINTEPVCFDVQGLSSKDIQDKYGNRVAENEKLIRFIQTKDRILKLVCDELLLKDPSIGSKDRFKLSEIHPTSLHNPLERQAEFKHKIIRKGTEVFFTVVAKDTKEQIQEVIEYEKITSSDEKEKYPGQKWYQWTIKDFGRFKRFLKDRRLPNLSEYFEDKDITFDFLEYQIKEYDKYRNNVFDLTFELEKSIATSDLEGIRQIEQRLHIRPKGFFEIEFDVYVEWLDRKGIQYNKDLINECRNRFSHSEFPKYEHLNQIPKITRQQIIDFEYNKRTREYKNNADISISEKITNQYKTEIEQIIHQIRLQ